MAHTRSIAAKCAAALLLLTLVAVPSASAESMTDADLKTLRERWEKKTAHLVPTPNRSRTMYSPGATPVAYLAFKSGSYVPPVAELEVEIVEIHRSKNSIDVSLRRKAQGNARLQIASMQPDRSIPLDAAESLLASVLRKANQPASTGNRILNLASRLIHARGANHLPEATQQQVIPDGQPLPDDGVRLCAACFRPNPRISGYDTEASLGRVWAGQTRSQYPLIADIAVNQRVQTAGERVLARWPIALRGYDYNFTVVRSPEPNAFACPAGEIFVTTGLMNSIDEEAELETVLAHEIAHVERRHGYRQLQRARRAGLIAGILGTAVGVAAGSGEIAAAAVLMSSIAATAILAGYSRAEEEEADVYAAALGALNHDAGGRSPAHSIFSKLQYYQSVTREPDFTTATFDSHPTLQNRINKLESMEVFAISGPRTFAGLNAEGDVVAYIQLENMASSDYVELSSPATSAAPSKSLLGSGSQQHVGGPRRVSELNLLATVRSTAELLQRTEVKSIRLQFKDRTVRLDNREDTEIFQSDEGGMNFISENIKGWTPGLLIGLEAGIEGVTKWVPFEVEVPQTTTP